MKRLGEGRGERAANYSSVSDTERADITNDNIEASSSKLHLLVRPPHCHVEKERNLPSALPSTRTVPTTTMLAAADN